MENDNKIDNNNDALVNKEIDSNINEEKIVNDVSFDEKKKNIKSVIFIVLFVIILIGIGIYGLFIIDWEDDSKVSNNDENVNIDDELEDEEDVVSTFSDDVVREEENNSFDGKVINIYQKGYAENGPIAFTYECKSEDCDLRVTDKGFILYDDEVVKYREMTTYEYEQINNSEVSPVGAKLDMTGFEEVESVYDKRDIENYEYATVWDDVYIIENQIYLYNSYNEILQTYTEYRRLETDLNVAIIDNYILSGSCLYDYLNKKVIDCFGETGFTTANSNYGKIGNVYYFITYSSACPCYEYFVYNANTNELKSNVTYISNDINGQIYYMEYINDEIKVYLVSEVGETNVYTVNVDIGKIHIFKNKMAYLDKENKLNLRDLNTGDFSQYDMSNNTYGELSSVEIIGINDNEIEVYVGDYSVYEDKTKRQSAKEQSKEIKDNIPSDMELEAFVHGAMCISYSGRCLLSNYLTNRDANKGECSHPCRWKYYLMEEQRPGEYFPVFENERGTFIFNSKDLCMIEHVGELIEAGVKSFKIEGRVKSEYYVATITKAYRKAIDDYYDNKPFDSRLLEEIKKVSNRDYTKGFYFGKPDNKQQVYTSSSYLRDYDVIGFVTGYDYEKKELIFSQRNKCFVGDEIEIMPFKGDFVTMKIKNMKDENDNYIDSCPHAQMTVKIKSDICFENDTIIRKKRE